MAIWRLHSIMKKFLRNFLQAALRFLPLTIYKKLLPRNPIGVFYHAVTEKQMLHVQHLYPPITATQFEQSLLYLKKHYTLVGYEQLHAHVIAGAALPPNAAHLSFDDGFVECYTVVRPLLLKHEIPCTFFVTSGWLDNQAVFYRNKVSLAIEQMGQLDLDARRMVFMALNNAFDTRFKTVEDFKKWIMPLVRADEPQIDMVCRMLGIDAVASLQEQPYYMSREQIKQMHADGFTIGSHTRSHPKLVQVDVEDQEVEIVESSRVVQEITGQAIVPFSFPNSGTGLDRAVLADIRARHDFLGLFFDTQGLKLDEPFILNRMWAEHRQLAHRRGEATNLPRVLHAAYHKAAWRAWFQR